MTTFFDSYRLFRGCFTAIATPFTADGSAIDFKRLEQQLDFQAKGGVRGIVASGTTGESPTLSHEEWRELVKFCVKLGRERKLMIIAGTGSNSTAHACEMQKEAADLGADAALSVNPYYNKPTQDGMIRHFKAVADASPLPVMLYNIPGRSGVALTFETIRELSQHPRIAAVKDAMGNVDLCGQCAMELPRLAVLSGDDPLTLPMMSLGAIGVVSVLSNIVPREVSELCVAASAGKFDAALAIHRKILPLTRAMFVETNPVPLKAALEILGRDSGALRLPMSRASSATFEKLRAELGKLGMC